MMTKILLGVAVVVLLGAGAYFYMQSAQQPVENQPQANNQTSPPPAAPSPSPDGNEGTEQQGSVHVITYTDDGYSPAQITVQKGDTVTFRNESSRDMWPATAIHPSHTVYPGSSIGKCDTEEEESIFDACRAVGPSGEYSFMFSEVGEWNYHDHLRATNWGSIIVEG